MSSDEPFAAVLAAARDGSGEAIAELLEQFGPGVLRAVRRKLARELRSRFDSVDFVQAVWCSFFTDAKLLADVDSPESLTRLLAVMAHNKVVQEFRGQLQTDKRDLRRTRSLHDSATQEAVSVPDRYPTPSKLVIAEECWEQLLASVPSRHREILLLRREGMTHRQIAEQLKVHERTVERVLSRLHQE